jgi:membrane fusion protein (multidrug efflux system)
VRENQFVAAGDVVVQLDDSEYRIALAAIEARLATQDARINQITELKPVSDASLLRTDAQREKAAIDLRQAEATLVRAQTLATNGDTSKVTLSEAIASRDRAKVGLAITEADVTTAQAEHGSDQFKHHEAELVREELLVERDRLQNDLEHTRIRAPLSGRIGKRRVEPGDYVAVGQRLAAIVPDSGFFIEANVKESQLAHLCVGQPAQIALDAFPASPLVGHIESFAPATGAIFSVLPPENATGNFNKITQRVTVRLALDHDEQAQPYLRAGLSAVIHIDTRQSTGGWRACAAPAQVIASP